MGVAMGTSGLYVVVSAVPHSEEDEPLERRAMFIGRLSDLAELDALIAKFSVRMCLVSPQPEPHLITAWQQAHRDSVVQLVLYTDDGISGPRWEKDQGRVTVDRTFAMNSVYEEIKAGRWWIPPTVRELDNGEFYAQMKAPTRVRDVSSGAMRYRWMETGTLDHYRHAQVYDHLAADLVGRNPAAAWGDGTDGPQADWLCGDYRFSWEIECERDRR